MEGEIKCSGSNMPLCGDFNENFSETPTSP